MKIRIYADENVSIVVDENDHTEHSDFIEYNVGDGCQAVNCEISKPKQGHNGGCSCFNKIPVKFRGRARHLVYNHSLLVNNNVSICEDMDDVNLFNNDVMKSCLIGVVGAIPTYDKFIEDSNIGEY